MDALCHSREEIERMASRLPCVPTDNIDALIDLGFERMYPHVISGYESRLWIRSVEHRYGGSIGAGRKLIVQRAYLDGPAGKVRTR
jgi:hypothetical protein